MVFLEFSHNQEKTMTISTCPLCDGEAQLNVVGDGAGRIYVYDCQTHGHFAISPRVDSKLRSQGSNGARTRVWALIKSMEDNAHRTGGTYTPWVSSVPGD